MKNILDVAPELFNALGSEYADFMIVNSFDFDFCDVIGALAQIFYDNGDLSLKAEISLGALGLGSTHNRWSVERKFVTMASNSISQELADRIAVEVDVREFPFAQRFKHLMHSITISKLAIHPTLAALLND